MFTMCSFEQGNNKQSNAVNNPGRLVSKIIYETAESRHITFSKATPVAG